MRGQGHQEGWDQRERGIRDSEKRVKEAPQSLQRAPGSLEAQASPLGGEKDSERVLEEEEGPKEACACVMRSRGDAETLQASLPCSSSSISHLLLIPLDQRVRQRAPWCLHTRNEKIIIIKNPNQPKPPMYRYSRDPQGTSRYRDK